MNEVFRNAICIGLVFCATSCGTVEMHPERHIRGLVVSSTDAQRKEEVARIAHENRRRLDAQFLGTRRPRYALALSGGGMRAATYAIGVMNGLQELGEFDEIDLISGASGGAYALSWYYLQQYYVHNRAECDKDSLKQLLDPDGPFQMRLAGRGDLASFPRIILYFLANLAAVPVNLVANGLFGLACQYDTGAPLL